MNDKLFEYIENGLKKDKLDGLCNEALECGCGLDDLMPCQDTNYCDSFPDCEPAKRVKKGSKECGDCEVDDCHGHCFKTPDAIEEILKEVQPSQEHPSETCGAKNCPFLRQSCICPLYKRKEVQP